jgi:16S rRNA (uracil1498-N3)-methyltransferase
MQRYFIPLGKTQLSDTDQHHIKKVMRMKTGDQVIICSDSCHLVELTIKEDVTYKMIKALEKIKKRKIILVQGLPKHPKLETTIKYATMAGVDEIICVPMMYSIVKDISSDSKMQRYDMIAKEASELSHRDDVPKISLIKTLKEIDLLPNTYLFDEKSNDIIQDRTTQPVMIIIGPEGGIHEDERQYLLSNGVKNTSLGPLIYSSEIAGVLAIQTLMTFL